MRISDWSSDVCSSDLQPIIPTGFVARKVAGCSRSGRRGCPPNGKHVFADGQVPTRRGHQRCWTGNGTSSQSMTLGRSTRDDRQTHPDQNQRSEEHTSELQSLMRNSYAVFCLKKKNKTQ